MKAMIFAAGLGTRLRPLTDTMPKALVPVAGIPMLERVLTKLKAAGYDEFVVNVHHFAEKIIGFLDEKQNFGVKIDVSLEKEDALETGGGIRKAAPLLGGCGRFIVHNADILSNLDVEWFRSQDRPDALATLLVREAEADRYLLFDDDMRLVGWTNVRTGEVKSPFADFDPSKYHRYSFCGIHILSDEIPAMMQEWPEKFSIIDFYLKTAASRPIVGVLARGLELIDIGSPEKLAEADALYQGR